MSREWLAPDAVAPARERLARLAEDPEVRGLVAAAPDVSARVAEVRRAVRLCLLAAPVAAVVAFVALLLRGLPFRDEIVGFSACVSGASLVCVAGLLVLGAIRARAAVRGTAAVIVEREEEWWWNGRGRVWPRHLVRVETPDGRRRRHVLQHPTWDGLCVGDFVVLHTHLRTVVGLQRVDTLQPGRAARPAPHEGRPMRAPRGAPV